MENNKKQEYINRIEDIIAQYESSSSITNYVVINLLKELTGNHIKMTTCGPCLMNYYRQLIDWKKQLEREIQEMNLRLVDDDQEPSQEAPKSSIVDKAIEEVEDYSEPKKKRGRPRKKK